MQAFQSRDFVGGAASLLIGSVYLYFAYQMRSSALDDIVGPAGMPKAYGWVLVGLGTLLCTVTLANRWREDFSEEWVGRGRQIAAAAGLLGLGIAYLVIVDRVGYLLSMGLLIAATILYHGERPSAKLAMTAVLGAAMLWTLFVLVLGVSMPPGLLRVFGL